MKQRAGVYRPISRQRSDSHDGIAVKNASGNDAPSDMQLHHIAVMKHMLASHALAVMYASSPDLGEF